MFDRARALHQALRTLRKTPGFALTVVATLALGIGGATSIFSLVEAVLLRPLPYPEPGRLVLLRESTAELERLSISVPDLRDWQAQNRSFEAIAGFRRESFTLTGEAAPERVTGRMVSHELLPVLGLRPALGRGFLDRDDGAGARPTVVLGNEFWRRHFGGDPSVVGTSLELDGVAHKVLGVLPPRFELFPEADLFVPLGPWAARQGESRGSHPGLWAIGRLRPGVSLDEARAEMATIASRLGRAHPKTNEATRAVVTPLRDELVRSYRTVLLALLAAVGVVLLICCVNVANLMLVRARSRREELSVRAALGAGRGRVLEQFLAESLVLALLGGGLGLALAFWGTGAVLRLAPSSLPRQGEIGVDAAVLAFASLITILTGIAFGVLPGLRSLRGFGSLSPLRETTSGARAGRWRAGRLLVALEVALALVLLAGTGLLARSLESALSVETGFAPAGVMTARLSWAQRTARDGDEMMATYRSLLRELGASPGVQRAALSSGLPLVGASEQSFWPGENPPADRGDLPLAVFTAVTPGYFDALGISRLRGRTFDWADRSDTAPVCVIDRRLAERFFPGEEPLGKKILLSPSLPPFEIVGEVAHVRHYGLDAVAPVEAQLYVPLLQVPGPFRVGFLQTVWVTLRGAGEPASLAPALQAGTAQASGRLALDRVRSLGEIVDSSLAPRRFHLLLTVLFSAVALALAGLGLYGVIAYSVGRRNHEIGVRMALGATPGRVTHQVVVEGLLVSLWGVAAGLVAAPALTRALRGLLFGVSASDPATFVAVSVLLLAVAAAASYLPARRAARIDPRETLRRL